MTEKILHEPWTVEFSPQQKKYHVAPQADYKPNPQWKILGTYANHKLAELAAEKFKGLECD